MGNDFDMLTRHLNRRTDRVNAIYSPPQYTAGDILNETEASFRKKTLDKYTD